MEMLCPECMGPMVSQDGRKAVCTLHGGQYQILFSRHAVAGAGAIGHGATGPVAPAGPIETRVCPRHVTADTVGNCGICGEGLCQTCAFPQPNGTLRCPECAAGRFRAPSDEREWMVSKGPHDTDPPIGPASLKEIRSALQTGQIARFALIGRQGGELRPMSTVIDVDSNLAPPTAARGHGQFVPPSTMCRVHPTVQAIAHCHNCRAPVCTTCDFAFPGGVHLCPACASRPQQGLSPKRRGLLGWSYGLAIWTTVGVVALLSGIFVAETKSEEEMFGIVLQLFVFVPSLVGTALGYAAMDRRLGNSGWIWGAAIWNSVVLAGLILLTIVGLTMG